MPLEFKKPATEKAEGKERKEENIDKRVVSSMVKAAKNSTEATDKLSDMLMESLDKGKFKKMIIEETLKDPELRNKVMLELIKKL